MADPNVPTRNQIAKVAGNDPEMIKALERLFIVAGDLTPADIAIITQLILDNSFALGVADNKAEVASTIAYAAQRLADLIALQPAPIDPLLERLHDVLAFSPDAEDILQYDATVKKWAAVENPVRSTNVLLWLEAY
jgi:hypothetical protein